jgi:hypothetical protein
VEEPLLLVHAGILKIDEDPLIAFRVRQPVAALLRAQVGRWRRTDGRQVVQQ